jgi:putative ABC transport system permease protein
MNHLLQDLRYAVRQLRSHPAFTLTAVATLALGIGANTAIFSVINGVLFRSLPYREPERLIAINHLYPSLDSLNAGVSVPGFRDYRAASNVLASGTALNGWAPTLTGQGDPDRILSLAVTGDYFTTLGVTPLVGRAIQADDATEGKSKVVVLGNGFWRRHFAGDPKAVGQKLVLDGESYEIVGVLPPEFKDYAMRQAELWTPLVFRPDQFADRFRTSEFLTFYGRLRPGTSVDQATREFAALAERLKKDFPDSYPPDWTLKVTPVSDLGLRAVRGALYVLLGAVGFVLLIACANVANLQFTRAAGRSREIAVRLALGASPGALVRQLLVESILVAVAGGVIGLAIAAWAVPALIGLNPDAIPRADQIRLDGTVMAYTLGIAVVSGILFGLAPALQVRRADLQRSLKEGGRGNSGDRGGLAVRRTLVVCTVALALTLLTGAGLLIRSFARVVDVNPGFDADRLLTFQISLPAAKYDSAAKQVLVSSQLQQAVAAVPGVKAVGTTTNIPFSGNFSTGSFSVEGYQPAKGEPMPWGDQRIVSPGFQQALGMPRKAGRFFTDQDQRGSPLVAVVDESLARRYFPGGNAVGKRITYSDLGAPDIRWIEIVGVVGHVMHEGLDAQGRVQVYRPLAQVPVSVQGFVIRTAGQPDELLNSIRQAVRSVDPDLPITGARTMAEMISASTGPRQFTMVLLGIFSGIALLLASVGLYGVMSYAVTQRTQELGIRLALGAAARDVLQLVLSQGMRLALVGIGIGLVAAFFLTRLIKGMLYDVPATDPITFGLIALLLTAVTLFAAWLPAHRATRVNPLVALREE